MGVILELFSYFLNSHPEFVGSSKAKQKKPKEKVKEKVKEKAAALPEAEKKLLLTT
jgi:hypothetical protein